MKKFSVFLMTLVLGCFIGFSAYADINDGLVTHYPFDGNADDASGNGNHGVEYGAVNFTEGVLGQAVVLQGTGDFIESSNNLQLNSFPASFSAWVNTSTGGYLYASDFWENYWADYYGFCIFLGSTGGIGAMSGDGGYPNAGFHSEVGSYEFGEWAHIVVVFVSARDIKVYVNGVEKFGNYTGRNISSIRTLDRNDRIGYGHNIYAAYGKYTGFVDEVRIYNRALSEEEVQSLFLGVVDTDGDDIPDDEDECPESDLSETVVIDGCDSGVKNELFDEGCTMSDLIDELADSAENKGQFVSSVSHLTNDWKKEQLITGSEKGAIISCAVKIKIPDCRFNEGVIILDTLGIDFDQDGTVDLEYLSKDFLGNPGPFLTTEGGSYCGGTGIGSGNRIASGPGFGIADFCSLDTAINFVPSSDSIGTYATYTGGGPGEIFIVRAFDGTGYFKIQIIDELPDKIYFSWAEVSPPDCETCLPGQDGMDVCFP